MGSTVMGRRRMITQMNPCDETSIAQMAYEGQEMKTGAVNRELEFKSGAGMIDLQMSFHNHI